MQIYTAQQGTVEWMLDRKGKITGSVLSNIIPKRGTAPKAGFWQIIADKVAEEPDDENAMERGSRLEDEAIAEFEKSTEHKVDRVGLCVSDFDDRIAVSPDGLIKQNGKYNMAIEVKCLSSAKHIQAYFEDTYPSEYEEQVLQYFVVCEDLDLLFFVLYDPRVTAKPLLTFCVQRKDVQEKVDLLRNQEIEMINRIDSMVAELTF